MQGSEILATCPFGARRYKVEQSWRQRCGSLGAIAALHFGILLAALLYHAVQTIVSEPQLLDVSIKMSEKLTPPKPEIRKIEIPKDVLPTPVDVPVVPVPELPPPEIAAPSIIAKAVEIPSAPVTEKAKPDPGPVITQPRFDADYLANPAPRYPALSRRLSEQGTVQLRVHVLANGSPDAIELKRSSSFSRLDEAAKEAVMRWRFIPAKQDGQNVAAWVIVPIAFSLSS